MICKNKIIKSYIFYLLFVTGDLGCGRGITSVPELRASVPRADPRDHSRTVLMAEGAPEDEREALLAAAAAAAAAASAAAKRDDSGIQSCNPAPLNLHKAEVSGHSYHTHGNTQIIGLTRNFMYSPAVVTRIMRPREKNT
jgi:hypothetical protein